MAFDWFKKKDDLETKTKRQVVRPASRNITENLVCNVEITRGLYHNSYPGIKLGGALAFAPIAVPASLMGLPIPVSSSKSLQDSLNEILEGKSTEAETIHIEANRDGTIWIWPWYDSDTGSLEWEHISDDLVTLILKDEITGKPVEIWVEEQITRSLSDYSDEVVTKRRKFRKDKITMTVGNTTRVTKNVAGILPVWFSNEPDAGDLRGHSDYERIISDLKAYADISQQMLEDLANFRTKMIQSANNADDWMDTNGFTSLGDVNISDIDFILNLKDQESTEFIIPSKVADGYIAALKILFKKIVEGSGIPEIAWGLKTEGNNASVEESMGILMRYVGQKRKQYTNAWEILLTASLKLMNIVNLQQTDFDIKVTWDRLDALSELTRSIIIKNTAEAVSKLVDAGGMTKAQLYAVWQTVLPDGTESEFEEFTDGIRDMAGFKAFKDAEYETQLTMAGVVDN